VTLLRDRRLLGLIGAGGCFYGGVYAYIAGSPFAYIGYHHVPAQLYGFLFGSGIIGIMIANTVNSRLVAHVSGGALLVGGAGAAALSGAATTLAAWFDIGGVWGLAIPLLVFVAANGFIVANSIAAALDRFPDRAGAVSALVGALQYGSGIIGSALVGLFADGTPFPMACVIALAGVGSLICAWTVSGRRIK